MNVTSYNEIDKCNDSELDSINNSELDNTYVLNMDINILKTKFESLTKKSMRKIYKLLINDNVKIFTNKSSVGFNLKDLSDEQITKINQIIYHQENKKKSIYHSTNSYSESSENAVIINRN